MKYNTKTFIVRAKEIHGDKYDYSKVEYINCKTKICIICKEHGEFWQTPNSHLNGNGCAICKGVKRKTTNQFIEEAKEIHGDKYDYSKVEYVNAHTKVDIICPIHGEFLIKPCKHLNGQGCGKCGGNLKKNQDIFIDQAKLIHGDKYDYSKVEYINTDTKVCIICPIHGEFWQKPYSHLQGKGCLKCSGQGLNIYERIETFKKVHGDKYDYSKVEYINNKSKICIICKEHGEFWQTPNDHLNGCGCPYCSQSHLENKVMNILNENNISFEYQKKFDWLGLQSLDFYIQQYNIGIECQGIQHFKPIKHFGGEENLKTILMRDAKKLNLCKNNNIDILYINYNDKEIKEKIENYISLIKCGM